MAYVSTVISGAACLGVLLALISGIFFLVLAAVKWVSRVRSSLYEEELARQKKFLVGSSCLLGSPDFLPTKQTGNGFGGSDPRETEQGSQRSPENSVLWNAQPTDHGHQQKQDPGSDTIKVRELMEKMVETMIGGPLDGTTVGQLSTHSAYVDMFTRYHNLLCRELARLGFALHLSLTHKGEDSPDAKDSSLKRLIKKIMSEAMDLPSIRNVARPLRSPEDAAAPGDGFESKSYEDILATAILNKVAPSPHRCVSFCNPYAHPETLAAGYFCPSPGVYSPEDCACATESYRYGGIKTLAPRTGIGIIIENFQRENRKGSQLLEGNPKPRIRHRKPRKNHPHDDLKSDGDWSDTSRSDQLSLTIEEYIEEVTTGLEGSEDDRSELSDLGTTATRRIPFPESGRTVVDAGTDDENSEVEEQSAATELVTSTSSWEENWLFQKKRLRSTPNAHHPVPVPMLVPNPSEDFRALVGGVDADELSDMSECSDSALEELITTEAKPVEVVKVDYSSSEEAVGEKSNEKVKVILTHITEESFLKKLGGNKDDSCSGVEGDRKEEMSEDTSREDAPATGEHIPSARSVPIPASTDSEDSLIRCRVAEREKEKWMNPVPLPDNPYSLENIEKREQQRRINQYFRIGTYAGESIDFPDDPTSPERLPNRNQRFTRDYYVNASKHPSGRSSPSQQSDQVSRHSYGAFSSPPSQTNPRLYPDIADGSARYFTLHHLRPIQSLASRQHFSQVFKTSATLIQDLPKPNPPRRYRYGSHTVKLRPKTRPSLQQELSHFEQKSLRGDLTHFLLRARDASPNFILNPVYNPDPATRPNLSVPFSAWPHDSIRCPHSDADSELDMSRVAVASCCGRFVPPDGKGNRTSRESGYGSDSLEHSSDSLECWRLTPPKTPEVVESSFVPVVKKRSGGNARRSVRKSLSSYY